MAYTGLRNGELSGLAWEDIDLEARTLTVRRATDSRNMMKTPKTDLERVVDLHPPAIEALLSQKSLSFMRPSDRVAVELPDKTVRYDKVRYVFLPNVINASTNYPFMAKITMIRMWESVCKLAGIHYRPFYQLRHTFASWSLTAHGNVAYIAGQMGHKDYSMLIKVYGRWMPSESKKEHERIWNELESMGHKFKKCPEFAPKIKKGVRILF